MANAIRGRVKCGTKSLQTPHIYMLMETELAQPNQEKDFAVRMDSIIENVSLHAATVKKVNSMLGIFGREVKTELPI